MHFAGSVEHGSWTSLLNKLAQSNVEGGKNGDCVNSILDLGSRFIERVSFATCYLLLCYTVYTCQLRILLVNCS
jgi:hypothetical protein